MKGDDKEFYNIGIVKLGDAPKTIDIPLNGINIYKEKRFNKTRNIRATIAFDNKMLMPSGVAYMPALDR